MRGRKKKQPNFAAEYGGRAKWRLRPDGDSLYSALQSHAKIGIRIRK